jgi:hypothetical protein
MPSKRQEFVQPIQPQLVQVRPVSVSPPTPIQIMRPQSSL